jgi:hypothetical protein
MVAGHIALSAIKIEGTTSSAGVGLAPLSVRPELQRRGLGALDCLSGRWCRVRRRSRGRRSIISAFGLRNASLFGLEMITAGMTHSWR